MENAVEKAYEITDAKITFVSLVDRAANKRKFLLTKAEDGKASFTTFGRIVKTDAQTHYVTGIVYEPMEEDTHGNYMTEAEIEKAAHWFAKNGNMVDLQHSFEPLDGASVVESWIAKADFEIDGQTVKKGTWLMTVEVSDEAVWNGIEKGDITGFSMGGIGTYSEEDTNLDDVEKSGSGGEKFNLLKQLGKFLGIGVVEKGGMAETFAERSQSDLFWSAFSTLQEVLTPYNTALGEYSFETDEEKIRESLTEFSAIVTDILASKEPIAKSLAEARPVTKAGKAMSQKNRETLTGIRDSLDAFLKSFEPEEDPEEDNAQSKAKSKEDEAEGKEDEQSMSMTKQEIMEAVAEGVRKGMEKSANASGSALEAAGASEASPVEKNASAQETPEITLESVQKMVRDAVTKAMEPKAAPEAAMTAEEIQAFITKSVDEAMEPIRKARGLPSNLGSASAVEKQEEQHYLHGIL